MNKHAQYNAHRFLKTPLGSALALALTAMTAAPAALAQDDDGDEENRGTIDVLLEEVIVTARKREELAQQTPLSVTAYNDEQIEALKVRKLDDLAVGMPNVALDDIGTAKGLANFSIRGLGINSSIPSIDPTVGVFIDGVYMGMNAGLVFDMFDLASIEVLRGPQGTLFGRNVTGGAILVNTHRPSDELEVRLRAAVDGNPNGDGGMSKYFMGSISGAVTDTLGARMSVYYNDDDGYHVNLFDGSDHGKAETTIIRPVITWSPAENVDLTVRWEHMESDNDGPSAQNHTNGSGIPGFFASFDRDSFDMSIDEPGFYNLENDLVTAQLNWYVDFGDGVITNIFGWKDYYANGLADIDAQPVWLFHADSWLEQEQVSNELRYNGTFGAASVTTGIYWFTQDIGYHEGRRLLGVATGGVAPALTQDGGGLYDVDSLAWFGTVDYDITDDWTLTGGLRYTDEEKSAQIASLIRNVDSPCNVVVGATCPYDFVDDASWSAWSGKFGAMYRISDDMRVYGHWSRSQRSGGYNLRNTAIDTVNLGPGPFDEEVVDSIEFGLKTEFAGRGNFNAAVFYNTVEDMQREVNLSDPISGVVQVIKNTADADLYGFELDGMYAFGTGTLLTGSVGYTKSEYATILFDLNGDGVINEADKALKLPRAPELTWSVGLNQDWDLGDWGWLSGRVSYAYRDDAFYTDNNLGYFLSQDIVDAGLDWGIGEHWVLSLYGRNLLDSVNHGGDTQLPAILGPVPTGGTFSPLVKGRVVGVELTFEL